ncbi:hypothetical protein BGZ98_007510 [Dissophora globulifera]|nr:hypothetical protein BGZ98_007510 [Dissophora globulifera]
MAGVIQVVLPIFFDFRISVAQTKPAEKDDKQSIQDSKNDFTLKLFCDQTEVNNGNFYAGGSSHRWIQYYTTEEGDQKIPVSGSSLTMDEFINSTSNPLTKYFLQPEETQPSLLSTDARLDLGVVKESWVAKEMRAREGLFTEYSFMHAFVSTWNVNGRTGPENMDAWLHVEGDVKPDLYVLCFQELDLSAEAYIVFDGSKEEEWTRGIAESLGSGYQKVMSKQLVGLLIVMYAATDHAKYIKEVTAHSAGVGIMGVLGNKGGVSVRIRYKDSYLCFVGSHLAADTNQIDRRNQDYQEICRRLTFPSTNAYDITKGPSVNAALAIGNKMVSIFDCDHTIWAGDLNYRIALPEDQVKHLLRTNDYDSLMKHDQLTSQRSMFKAFSEFDEHPINFQPTYKYDVGTSTWDSSEKRRVPAYTDRILWRSKDIAKDSVETLFYKSHMELTISDHKPVSALFKLKVKTLMHDKQVDVHQTIVRELDRYENECMPDATISSSNVDFGEVHYLEPKEASIKIKNTGQFPAQCRFKPKLQDERFCKPWIWANPPVAMLMPGESAKIHLTVMVDNESAPLLNTGKEKLDDILVLHLEHGKDYFISVSGNYIRTCFGNSLEWLSRLDRPIRLWNPDEDDEDEDEDDTLTLYDAYNVMDTKSALSGMKDVTIGDGSRTVKNGMPLDSVSDKEQGRRSSDLPGAFPDRKMTDERATTTVPAPAHIKKQKVARPFSLPKDLWRILDFIYKYGFAMDNLFLLSGDQSTMSYIRECLDTGEEFDLTRLLDKPSQQDTNNTTAAQKSSDSNAAAGSKQAATNKTKKNNKKGGASNKDDDENDDDNDASNTPAPLSSSTVRGHGSGSDLKPQIARPVSIMNGIPPKAANFGLRENRGIHSMAEVLLRFLESLRKPVVPTEMYQSALEASKTQQAALGLLDLMPPVHVNVFVYITSFLRELILVGGSYSGSGAAAGSHSGKDGISGVAGHGHGTSTAPMGSAGPGSASGSGLAGANSGSVHTGIDGSGTSNAGGRMKREDEDFRVAKLAAVFSSVMLRPPPGAKRLSEVDALERKTFLMHFLQEPVEEKGVGGGGVSGLPSTSSSAAVTAASTHGLADSAEGADS